MAVKITTIIQFLLDGGLVSKLASLVIGVPYFTLFTKSHAIVYLECSFVEQRNSYLLIIKSCNDLVQIFKTPGTNLPNVFLESSCWVGNETISIFFEKEGKGFLLFQRSNKGVNWDISNVEFRFYKVELFLWFFLGHDFEEWVHKHHMTWIFRELSQNLFQIFFCDHFIF